MKLILRTGFVRVLLVVLCLGNDLNNCVAASNTETATIFPWKKKKNKNATASADSTKSKSKGKFKSYNEIITDSLHTQDGLFKVHHIKENYYFEIPFALEDRDFLVVNKLSKVTGELNEAGLNKGINYENKVIIFDIDTLMGKVFIRDINPYVECKKGDAIEQSVKDNFRPSISEFFKIEALSPDSSAVVIKVNKIYDGSNKSINSSFDAIGIGGSAKKDHSHIIKMKSFPKNILVRSELTTKVTEGQQSVNVGIDVTSSLVLLPKEPMKPRFGDSRVGFFSNKRWYFSDKQQRMERRELVQRWRLEPRDEDIERYENGELVEPKKQIVYYLDPSTPVQWREYIKAGVHDWQIAFEQAGFKNAIVAKDAPTDVPDFDADDVRYSVITYAASPKANAMGPSVIDPRSGEILEADIIWWHNVLTAVHGWIRVQTGAIDPEARTNVYSDEKMGHAVRFVSSHEVGHTFGLMHNMGASYAYPVDSLRSKRFTDEVGGTAPSIMDYARFNYVAQPGDGVEKITPVIGAYDKYAIAWAYRWLDVKTPWEELPTLNKWINKHVGDPVYRYGEQQDSRIGVDPRSQSEDVGDDAVKASEYGIKNLQRIVPEIANWTMEEGCDYTEAGKLFTGVMDQWYTYAYHVMANVGGIYVNKAVHGDNQKTYTFVERNRQKKAVQFLVKHVFNSPKWLFEADILNKTFPVKNKPGGTYEISPMLTLRSYQSYIYWDMLRPDRIIRMLENEARNGSKAYTAVDMMDDLHRGIFAPTIKGLKLTVFQRESQMAFLDALIIAVDKYATTKNYKKLNANNVKGINRIPLLCDYGCAHHKHAIEEQEMDDTHSFMRKEINFEGLKRVSDDVSIKRGELLRMKDLLKKRVGAKDVATRYHYQDMILRIEHALNN